MPIRFRCAYCNQLMGIASRKAGTVVRCPKCAGEIIVPTPDGTGQSPQPNDQEPANPLAFDSVNFDVTPVASTDTNVSVPTPIDLLPTDFSPNSLSNPLPKRTGLFVPLGMLILSLAVIVLLLILVFTLGILIGRHTASP
jgi:hypothetical protein